MKAFGARLRGFRTEAGLTGAVLTQRAGVGQPTVPAVTEEVYRKQIRPVIQTGAVAMDGIFGTDARRP